MQLIPWRSNEPLRLADVAAFVAEDKYVTAYMADGTSHILDVSVLRISELDPELLLVRRGALVNPKHVVAVVWEPSNNPAYPRDHLLMLRGGKALHVARRRQIPTVARLRRYGLTPVRAVTT